MGSDSPLPPVTRAPGAGVQPGMTPDPTRNLALVDPTRPETPDPTRPVTVSELAAELGTTNPALRKWARRRDLLPDAPPGLPLTFTPEQADAVRGAWQTRDTRPDPTRPTSEVERVSTRPDPEPDPTRPVPVGPTPYEAEGWRVALANMAAERDTLRAELAVARVDAQEARREAAEAMRALAATNERIGAMRAAWWRWRQQLETLGPVARWRRRWPVAPGEFERGPLLAKPQD